MLTDEQLAELERLDREATPRPWSNGAAYGARVVDADLIAAARNALPELIAEVRRLRETLAKAEGRLSSIQLERWNWEQSAKHRERERDEARAELALARSLHDVAVSQRDGNAYLLAQVERERDEAREEVARLRERLQIDPGGSDRVDELEAALAYLREDVARFQRERATLLRMLASEFDWEDTSYLHAMMNVEPTIRALKAELAVARREGAAEMRERAANALTCDCDVNSRQCDEMQEWASTIRALPLPGEEP